MVTSLRMCLRPPATRSVSVPVTGNDWLHALGGDTLRLEPGFGGGSLTVRPFEGNIADCLRFGGGTTQFELLLPLGLKREPPPMRGSG